jgi:hypothetical protein
MRIPRLGLESWARVQSTKTVAKAFPQQAYNDLQCQTVFASCRIELPEQCEDVSICQCRIANCKSASTMQRADTQGVGPHMRCRGMPSNILLPTEPLHSAHGSPTPSPSSHHHHHIPASTNNSLVGIGHIMRNTQAMCTLCWARLTRPRLSSSSLSLSLPLSLSLGLSLSLSLSHTHTHTHTLCLSHTHTVVYTNACTLRVFMIYM